MEIKKEHLIQRSEYNTEIVKVVETETGEYFQCNGDTYRKLNKKEFLSLEKLLHKKIKD